MAIDWLMVGKWLTPKALKLAKQTVDERDAKALKAGRDEHAAAAANEIVRMILSGYTAADTTLSNLIDEFEAALGRGAVLPRDLRTLVFSLIEKARSAAAPTKVPWTYKGSSGGAIQTASGARGTPFKAARSVAKKKSPAKKAAAKKSPARKPSARKVAAKKAPAKRAAAGRA